MNYRIRFAYVGRVLGVGRVAGLLPQWELFVAGSTGSIPLGRGSTGLHQPPHGGASRPVLPGAREKGTRSSTRMWIVACLFLLLLLARLSCNNGLCVVRQPLETFVEPLALGGDRWLYVPLVLDLVELQLLGDFEGFHGCEGRVVSLGTREEGKREQGTDHRRDLACWPTREAGSRAFPGR